ncbi:hypothetical protein VKT23_012345 [Stygiomarasmius scandens]|uniref:Uncharacterized protein n=1 Tax=Marasmiellus scandens TaxID=2682957 RepID=A0ABR1J8G5_9AGAR
MSQTILSQESLAFVNSLDLQKPLSVYPKWFQSTKTIKENDAAICALVQHFYPEIKEQVKCTVNSTIIHKWEIVMGRDEKDRMGDLRRSHTDQQKRPCPVRKNPCMYIFLPEHAHLQVQTAFTIFCARRDAEQKARTRRRHKETQVSRQAKRASVGTVSGGTAIGAHAKGKQREQAQTPVSEESASVYRTLPSTTPEHAELIVAVQQIQNEELREMRDRHSTEMDNLLAGHREQMAALLAQDLHTGTSTVAGLPSPPPSSPFSYSSSSGAGPSTISKQESILASTDLTVIEKMPPKKRKADEEQDTSAKRRRAGGVDSKAYEIIDLLSDEE